MRCDILAGCSSSSPSGPIAGLSSKSNLHCSTKWLLYVALDFRCPHPLVHSELPKNLWGEAIPHTTVWLKNRPLDAERPPVQDFVNSEDSTQSDERLGTPFNRVTDDFVAAQSCRVRLPPRYIKYIQSGIGTADNRPNKPDLPSGIQVPITETNNEEQTELAMATVISEIEAIDLRRPCEGLIGKNGILQSLAKTN